MSYLGQKWINGDGTTTFLSAKYFVSGYAGSRHPSVIRNRSLRGSLLLTTWNIGSSKDAEVAAWKRRMEDGECSKIVVTLDGVVVEEYS